MDGRENGRKSPFTGLIASFWFTGKTIFARLESKTHEKILKNSPFCHGFAAVFFLRL